MMLSDQFIMYYLWMLKFCYSPDSFLLIVHLLIFIVMHTPINLFDYAFIVLLPTEILIEELVF